MKQVLILCVNLEDINKVHKVCSDYIIYWITSVFICMTNRKLVRVAVFRLFLFPPQVNTSSSPLHPGSRALANISKFTFVICRVVFTTMT